MLKLKNWHYLSYKDHFCWCVVRKTNAFLDVYEHFWKFQEVSQSCNMLQLGVERCGKRYINGHSETRHDHFWNLVSCPVLMKRFHFFVEAKRFHFVEAFTTLCKLAQQDTVTFAFRQLLKIFHFVEVPSLFNSRTKAKKVLSNYQNDYV